MAYHLVHAGAKTLLVDRKDMGRATDAGAGILSPATNTRDPDPWQRLAAHAVGYYPGLIESLKAEQEGETGFAICGMMIVAVSDDELEPFEIARRHIFSRRSRQGRPSVEDLYEISSDEARSRFPALADVQGAIYYREAARVDGRLLTAALRRAAKARGLTVRETGVEGLRDRPTIRSPASSRKRGPFRRLMTWSSQAARGRTRSAFNWASQIPVEPQRGQIMSIWDCFRIPRIRRRGQSSAPFAATIWCPGRTTGWWWAPRGKPAPDSMPARRPRVCGRCSARRCGWRPAWPRRRFAKSEWGLRPYTQDLLPVLGPVPGQEKRLSGNGARAYRPPTGPVQRQTHCRPHPWHRDLCELTWTPIGSRDFCPELTGGVRQGRGPTGRIHTRF